MRYQRRGIIYAIAVLLLLAHNILREDGSIDNIQIGSHYQYRRGDQTSKDTSGSADEFAKTRTATGRPSTNYNNGGVEYEIVTTNYGWNTPQSTKFSRRILSGELFNATLSHPRYNASAWADLHLHPDPNRRIIAFLDVDTCVESNYPVYGASNWKVNVEHNHPVVGKSIVDLPSKSCEYIKRAISSPALSQSHSDSRLILIDCCGVEKFRLRSACGRYLIHHDKVIVAYYSVEKSSARPLYDVGLSPPAIKPINLTTVERNEISSCQERKYLFSFQGRRGFGRENLQKFANETDMYIRVYDERDSYKSDIRTDGTDSNNFKGIMKQSTFAGAPRGDLLFSYRFSEIMSAGAIPVVYADNWLLPFNEHIIDWSKCAVFISESDYSKTGEILRSISVEKRCDMQKWLVVYIVDSSRRVFF